MTSPALRRVILESPYAGDVQTNVAYARRAVRDSVLRGEAPLASHLLYTQPGILDDDSPVERVQGMRAGWAWFAVADGVVVYADLGLSNGMLQGIQLARHYHRYPEIRILDDHSADPWIAVDNRMPERGEWVHTRKEGEVGENICCILPYGEWADLSGRTTDTHSTFAPPTHWLPLRNKK